MSKALIIVESPAKARTLKRYLGKDFDVKASVGHIRDLPVSKLGVDVAHDFEPQYETIKGKSKIVTELRKAAKRADEILLAPDPDREGEAIAYHIAHCLKGANKPVHRVLFHELTKRAILKAIEDATDINQARFEAQQARRILDRLVGYQISPLLWEKVRRGLSAGRVQSVAVRMINDREALIDAFTEEEYWTIEVEAQGSVPPPLTASLDKINGKKAKITNGEEADRNVAALGQAEHVVEKVAKKKRQRAASPPFITSTLQQDANRKLRFSAKKTMTLAQRLYEGIDLGEEGPTGLITYMRTDSTRVNDEALAGVRQYIGQSFGKDFLPVRPLHYKSSKGSQDAHEAIRPTDVTRRPEDLAPHLDKDLLALYTLIWKRFVASQMGPAIFDQTSISIRAGANHHLKAVGSVMRFLGFMTLYVEAVDEGQGEKNGGDTLLPDLKEGDILQVKAIHPKQHFTQPPPRFTEAALVKALEENGVGRPSTYAAIISTILDKEYVVLTQRTFRPTELGKLVNDLLVEHFPAVMDVEFTAAMEAQLDKVEDGQVAWLKILKDFYAPFKKTLDAAKEKMQSVKRGTPTGISCPLCQGELLVKLGKMGEFLACESYPGCRHTQNFRRGPAGEIIAVEAEEAEKTDENCDKCGQPMVIKHSRFGEFLACSGYPDCKNIRAQTTGVKCPEDGCDGEIVRKVSKRGKVFYSCSRYPKCKFAVWDKPVNKKCPQCGAAYLLEKQTKKQGTHLKCAVKECRFTQLLDGRD